MSTMSTLERVDFLKYSHTVGLCVMLGRGFSYPADTGIAKDGRLYVVNRGLDADELRQVRGTIFQP